MTLRHLRGGVALIGTAAEFASANPVLLERQLSLETDTGVEKIGDGTAHYADLDALPGGSGGGGSSGYVPGSDWLHAYAFAQTQTTTGTLNPEFAATDDPPPRGSSISWSADNASDISINDDGIYDVSARLWLRTEDPDGLSSVFAEIEYDGDNQGPFYAYDTEVPVPFSPHSVDVKFFVPGVAIAAGKTLRLLVNAHGGSLIVAECNMTVSRIA